MDLFDKAAKVAQDVGETVVNSAKSVGDYLKFTNSDQRDYAGLKVQLDKVNKELDSFYAEIGKRYVDYVKAPASQEAFNVDEILNQMESLMELKTETEQKIADKEQSIREGEKEKARLKALERFEREKKRLEDALRMDIISVEEFNEKVLAAQKKYENFDVLRKYDMQLNMQIITKEEYDAKVNELLK